MNGQDKVPEETEDSSRGRGQRVHLHTTIASKTRDLLRQLAGESGRLNDVLEEAVRYYHQRRDLPDCEDCPSKKRSKINESLIHSADMSMVNARLLSVLVECTMGVTDTFNLPAMLEKVGAQEMRLLQRITAAPDTDWTNSFNTLLKHVSLLVELGVVASLEPNPEKNSLFFTAKLFSDAPELLLLLLVAEWDAAGITVDVEIVGENKIAVKWVDPIKFASLRTERDERIHRLWLDRRESFSSLARSQGTVRLSPSLMDWLIHNTIADPISDRVIVSIREYVQQSESMQRLVELEPVAKVRKMISLLSSYGLYEKSSVVQDGTQIRVKIRSRTEPMKDLAIKLLKSLLALEGIEEVTREEGVATAIVYFSETRGIGRKYPDS
ncbi:hypothetical protein EU546_07915 [Candidatus Thorarchaeota archaeon]|nr:MAG: hypothetical protein EU546_07915 [Candidatus Thorarchaeota archaeon]